MPSAARITWIEARPCPGKGGGCSLSPMKRLAIALALSAALTLSPRPARACTMTARIPPPTQAEIDQWTRRRFAGAEAVVDVEATAGSSFGQPGRMRVVRVYKGQIVPGTEIGMRTLSGAMCGPGEFAAGSRGTIMIARLSDPFFEGYLSDREIALLQRRGLIPAPGQ